MRILLYITLILIGSFVGSKNLFPEKLNKKLNFFQNICLFFLLGVMGYKIGISDEIFSNFNKIGISALIISFFSVVFSIIFVKISCKKIVTTKKESDDYGN